MDPSLGVRSAEERERMEMGTYRTEAVGDVNIVIPDFTRNDKVMYDHRVLPATLAGAELLSPFLRKGSAEWKRYFETRKIVVQSRVDGKKFVSITTNISDAIADNFGPRPPRNKKFEVIQLLADPDLRAKFCIQGAIFTVFRNLAIVDTQRAAEKLQAHVRKYVGYDRATVSVGRYSGSWKWARDSVQVQAKRYTPISVTIESLVVADKIWMYAPDDHETRWSVSGPLKCASLIADVHKMVANTSPDSVAFALGMETTVLCIDIFDGKNVVCPVKELHYGPHTSMRFNLSEQTLSLLSARNRAMLKALDWAILPVYDGDDPVASCVRVGARHALLSNHVVEKCTSLSIGTYSMRPTYIKLMTADMWLVKLGEANEPNWPIRDAEVGEQVFLLYKRVDETQISDTCKVLSVGDGAIALSVCAAMAPGVSGAAIVAVKDMALLGVYEGKGLSQGLGSNFSPEIYTDFCAIAAEDKVDQIRLSESASEIAKLKAKGFSKAIDTAIKSISPIYVGGEHVGMALQWDKQFRTICNPDQVPLSVNKGDTPKVFHNNAGSPWFFAKNRVEVAAPVFMRKPKYGERVIVLGKDAEAPYFTTGAGIISHIGSEEKFFSVSGLSVEDALPLKGGLVLSLDDAAVLGVYATQAKSGALGSVSYCWALPDKEATQKHGEETAEEAISKVFPFLKVATWPEGLAEEAITHVSKGKYKTEGKPFNHGMSPIAHIGDVALKLVACRRMREQKLPTPRWEHYLQMDQCNKRFAEFAEKCGIAEKVRLKRNVVLGEGTKPHADVIEAIAGAVAEAETTEQLEAFAIHVGALREKYV